MCFDSLRLSSHYPRPIVRRPGHNKLKSSVRFLRFDRVAFRCPTERIATRSLSSEREKPVRSGDERVTAKPQRIVPFSAIEFDGQRRERASILSALEFAEPTKRRAYPRFGGTSLCEIDRPISNRRKQVQRRNPVTPEMRKRPAKKRTADTTGRTTDRGWTGREMNEKGNSRYGTEIHEWTKRPRRALSLVERQMYSCVDARIRIERDPRDRIST